MDIPTWRLTRVEFSLIPRVLDETQAIWFAATKGQPYSRWQTAKGQWIIFEGATQRYWVAEVKD